MSDSDEDQPLPKRLKRMKHKPVKSMKLESTDEDEIDVGSVNDLPEDTLEEKKEEEEEEEAEEEQVEKADEEKEEEEEEDEGEKEEEKEDGEEDEEVRKIPGKITKVSYDPPLKRRPNAAVRKNPEETIAMHVAKKEHLIGQLKGLRKSPGNEATKQKLKNKINELRKQIRGLVELAFMDTRAEGPKDRDEPVEEEEEEDDEEEDEDDNEEDDEEDEGSLFHSEP